MRRWRACKLLKVLCWRIICAPCLAGYCCGPRILSQQIFVLALHETVTCQLMGKKHSRETQRAKWHSEKETQTWRLPWIHASFSPLWDMQQGASWISFFLMLTARVIYLAVEWVLLGAGHVPGLLLSLMVPWSGSGKDTHILFLIGIKFNGAGMMVCTCNPSTWLR